MADPEAEGPARLLGPIASRAGSERAALVALLLLALLAPLQAPGNVALALFLAATIAARRSAVRKGEGFFAPLRRPCPALLPLAAFALLTVLSAFFSPEPARTIPELKGLWTLLLLPAALLTLRDREDAGLVLAVLRGAALYLVANATVELLAGRGDLETRLKGGTSNHMTFAGVLLPIVLALLAHGLDRSRPFRARLLDLVPAGLGTAVLVLSLTRNAYVGLLAGLATLLALARPRLVVALPVLGVALFLAAPPSARERALSSFDPADPTVADRLLMWRAGLAMVEDRPLLGQGLGRVGALYPAYMLPGAFNRKPGHLHNNVVMLAAETGVPSALAYLWLVAAFLVGAVPLAARHAPASLRPVAAGSVAAVVALTAAGLFEYNFGDVEVLRLTLLLIALPFGAGDPCQARRA